MLISNIIEAGTVTAICIPWTKESLMSYSSHKEATVGHKTSPAISHAVFFSETFWLRGVVAVSSCCYPSAFLVLLAIVHRVSRETSSVFTNIYTKPNVRILRLIPRLIFICQGKPGSWEGARRWSGNAVEKCSQELLI